MAQSEGPAQAGEDVARDAVRKRMTVLRLSGRRVATLAGVDKNTVGNYLSGRTGRPQAETVGAIESVLGWPVGTVDSIARGADVDTFVLMGSGKTANVLPRMDESPSVPVRPLPGGVYLAPEVEEGLTEAQLAEVRAHAYAEALRRKREIINGA